jgi:hypothetical protein
MGSALSGRVPIHSRHTPKAALSSGNLRRQSEHDCSGGGRDWFRMIFKGLLGFQRSLKLTR